MQDHLQSLRSAVSEGDAFKGDFVILLMLEETQSETIFEDLCQTANVQEKWKQSVNGRKAIETKHLNKTQLSGFLETMCCLFDKFALRQIRTLYSQLEDIKEVKSEVKSDNRFGHS